MVFESEKHFERYIRTLIEEHICKYDPSIELLKSKKAVDILICKNRPTPELFFIEVKHFIKNHGRLGFGSRKGGGFQPEILSRRPEYFEKNLRWLLSTNDNEHFYFLSNEDILNYISGGKISEKYNNIQNRLFTSHKGICEDELIEALRKWILNIVK